MEPAFYPGQPAGDQQPQSPQQFPLHNPASYGVANQFANVPNIDVAEDKGGLGDSDVDKQPRIKRKRASKACDACRVRKVKCDATRNPCPQCAEHNIPCLFTVPAKKRGPPNAYVEAQRAKLAQQQQGQADLDGQGAAVVYSYMDNGSGQVDNRPYATQSAMQEAMYHAHSPNFGTPTGTRPDMGLEELASPDVLNMIFDDFFALVYPIAPIVLESQFRRTLSNPALYTNDFLALCGAILSVTVVCLKSRLEHYGSINYDSCLRFVLARLGFGYRERISVGIAATLEFLALGSSFVGKVAPSENTRSTMFRAEATGAIQSLIYTHLSKGQMGFVDSQLLKRLYIHSKYFQSALTLQGVHAKIVFGSLSNGGLPEEEMYPLDLSDMDLERIAESSDETAKAAEQFGDLLVPSVRSYVPALILLHGLYKLYHSSDDVRNNENLAPDVRFAGIYNTLKEVRHYLDEVPIQLRWEENNKVHGLGFEVQKANLYVARMHLSSVLLEKCHMLESRSPGASGGRDLEKERRLVISETLKIIETISEVALEANGRAMVKRVRQVAVTLVDIIQAQKDSNNSDASEELDKFMKKLGQLDPSDARDTSDHSASLENREVGWRRYRHEQGTGT